MAAISSLLTVLGRRIGGGLGAARRGLAVALGPLLPLAALGLALAAAAPFAARHWWAADLATHFRPHYAAAGVAAVALALLARRRRTAVLLLALALPPLWGVAGPVRPGAAIAGPAAPAADFRVTTANIFWDNRDTGPLLAHLRAERPDILVLQEAWRNVWPALPELSARFPHRVPARPRAGDDVAILSRFPILAAERVEIDGFDLLLAEIEIGGRPVTVAAVHPPWRRSAAVSASRDRYLAALAARLAARQGPVVVAGDFNSTLWSPGFRDFLDAAGLASAGGGRLATWPAVLPAAGIAIDHIAVDAAVTVLAVRRGPDIGSDHLPLTADLALR